MSGHPGEALGAAAGRHRVLRQLGEGGMGAVWLVHDAEREEPVALKRMLARSPTALLRMKNEFRAIERLHHPALVRLYELGEDAEGLYFTMEAIEGTDLFSYCRGLAAPGFDTRDGSYASLPAEACASAPETAPTLASGAAPTLAAGPAPAASEDAPTLDGAPPAYAASEDAPTLDGEPPSYVPGSGPLDPSVPRVRDPLADASAMGALSISRLAHVLPQLLEALAFLHAHGIVHRDLKPANVLVGTHGELKVLDFGILAELGAGADDAIVGTAGYMAPEQARGELPTPAVDLHALGAMLFELVSGAPPFGGSVISALHATMTEPAPSLAGAAPEALVRACAALLSKNPEERPSISALAETLLPALGARAPIFEKPRVVVADLVGRDDERARLDASLARASAGELAIVVLEGPTGVGKTALVAERAEAAAARGQLVLRGRGRSRDRMPYNAIDAAVDALAVHLGGRRRSRRQENVRAAVEVASAAFPVLTRILDDEEVVAGRHPRHAVFAALADLLEAAARQSGGLILWIDDLQWADEDSVALLEHLIERGPAEVAIVATLRDDVPSNPGARWVSSLRSAERVEIGPLADEALATIVRETARERGAEPAADAVARAVRGCGGRASLAELAGRALGEGGAAVEHSVELLMQGVGGLGESILAALLAADEWTSTGVLARVVGLRLGEVDDTLDQLAARGLVRRSGPTGPGGASEIIHDVVRVQAMATIPPAASKSAHSAFADLLLEGGGAELPRRVRHLVGAGRHGEAAREAPIAAARAEAQHAYGLAADMYAVALVDESADRAALSTRRAAALEHAGRYEEAAVIWREIAEDASSGARVDAMLGESHALLAGMKLEEGFARLGDALAADGDAGGLRGGVRGIMAGLRFLRGPRRRAPASVPDPERVLHRAERDVRVGWLVGYLDPLAGMRFLQRALAGFERLDERERAAWVKYHFALFAHFGDSRRGPVLLGERWADAARQELDGLEVRSPIVRAQPLVLMGIRAARDGRYVEAIEQMQRGVDVLERGGMDRTFEHGLALNVLANFVMLRQRLDAHERVCDRLRSMVREVPDSAFHCHVVFNRVWLATWRGRLDEADAELNALASVWPRDPPTIQAFLIELFSCYPLLARGRADEVHRRLHAARKRYRAFRPLSTQFGPPLAACLSLSEALALRAGDRGASPRRIKRFATEGRARVSLWAQPAWRAMAYLADARGDREEALRWLSEAEQECVRLDTPLDGAIASYQLGRRLGGDEGARRMADARVTFEREGAALHLLDEDPGD